MKVQTSAGGYRDSSMGSKSGGSVCFPKKAVKESWTTADLTKKRGKCAPNIQKKEILNFCTFMY